MDKEIIIDGVNVAGCLYLTENLLCNRANLLDFHCVANQNCHYKQLHRTQQQYNAVVEQNRQLQEAVKAKEQECEELKKASLTLAEGLNIRQDKLDYYKQALDKIEKVLWHYHNNLYTPKNPVADEIEKRIFDIINEVKNAR